MKMKFQILKIGQKKNSPLEIRNSKFAGAFTLIEIMVAIAIFALLIAAVYSTWMVILKSSQVGNAAAARVQRERIAIRTLEDSLTCIQSFQASMGYYTFNVTNGDQPALSFVARLPDVFPRNGKFDSNLRRLTFSVETTATDTGSERDLVLRQNPILMDQDADEQQIPLVLARNVKDFIIECWDTNALDWMDEWDSTNSLPPMVRVTLALALDNKNDTTAPVTAITREIAMPSSTLPLIAQTGSPGGGGAVPGGGGNRNGNQNGPGGNGPGGNRQGNGGYGTGGFGNGGTGGFGGRNRGGNQPGGFGGQPGGAPQ
jgi:type II secretion system protein J